MKWRARSLKRRATRADAQREARELYAEVDKQIRETEARVAELDGLLKNYRDLPWWKRW